MRARGVDFRLSFTSLKGSLKILMTDLSCGDPKDERMIRG